MKRLFDDKEKSRLGLLECMTSYREIISFLLQKGYIVSDFLQSNEENILVFDHLIKPILKVNPEIKEKSPNSAHIYFPSDYKHVLSKASVDFNKVVSEYFSCTKFDADIVKKISEIEHLDYWCAIGLYILRDVSNLNAAHPKPKTFFSYPELAQLYYNSVSGLYLPANYLDKKKLLHVLVDLALECGDIKTAKALAE